MKRYIDPFEFAPQILKAHKKGVLLTACKDGKANTMTIGWAHLGIEWNTPTFIAYVRGCRHTKPMLDESGEFTVNIPLDDSAKDILRFCGTKSGRDTDKFAELGLTAIPGETVNAPAIKELPLTLECKVIYRQQQEPACVLDEHIYTHYKNPCDDIEQDYHTAYYGQILNAYIIE